MKKKWLRAILLLMILGLTGCHKKKYQTEATPTDAEWQTTNAADQTENAAPSEEEQRDKLFQEVIILDEEDIHVRLAGGKMYRNGEPMYYLGYKTGREETMVIKLHGLILNDLVQVDDVEVTAYKNADPEDGYYWVSLRDWYRALHISGMDSLQQVSVDLEVLHADGEVLLEKYIDVPVPEGIEKTFLIESCMGVVADAQVILDNDFVTAELLYAGSELSQSGKKENLCCLISVYNKTGRELHLALEGLTINGRYFDTNVPVSIMTGTKAYMAGRVQREDLERQGIRSIKELKLLIVPVNAWYGTGYENYEKENWWSPVSLAKNGDDASDEVMIPGETLYEDENVTIGLREMTESEGAWNSYYYWDITIMNRSEEDFSLSMTDVLVNGELQESVLGGLDLEKPEVGMESWVYTRLHYEAEEGEARPSISFQLLFKDIRREKILFRTEEPISIEPD